MSLLYFKACQCESKDAISIALCLLEATANPNIHDRVHGSTPLHLATAKGDLDLVSLLITHGARVNQSDSNNVTPLYIAAEKNFRDIAEHLVRNGTDVNTSRASDSMTSLLVASEKGHLDICKLILTQKDVNVRAYNTDKSSALLLATLNNHSEICKLLVDKIDVNELNDHGYCPLLIAAKNCNIKLMQIFLEHGADINCTSSKDRFTPLIMASMMGNETAVRFLLAKGADTEIQDMLGYTARGYAGLLGHDGIFNILMSYLQYGANYHLFRTPSIQSPKSSASFLPSIDTSSVCSKVNRGGLNRLLDIMISSAPDIKLLATPNQSSGRNRRTRKSSNSLDSKCTSSNSLDSTAVAKSRKLRRAHSLPGSMGSKASVVYVDDKSSFSLFMAKFG